MFNDIKTLLVDLLKIEFQIICRCKAAEMMSQDWMVLITRREIPG